MNKERQIQYHVKLAEERGMNKLVNYKYGVDDPWERNLRHYHKEKE